MTTDPTPPLSIVLPGSRAVELDSGERWQILLLDLLILAGILGAMLGWWIGRP